MSRGCGFSLLTVLCLGIALIAGIFWFLSDPVRGLWALADMNGSLSKWEERTVRVTSVERDCKIDPEVAKEKDLVFTLEDCGSPSNLKIALMAKLRSDFAGQPCFDDGPSSKKCPGVGYAYTGTATVTVSGINQNDGAFTSRFDIPSSDPGYYVVQTGDVINVDVCRKNPSIGRKAPRWAATKGC